MAVKTTFIYCLVKVCYTAITAVTGSLVVVIARLIDMLLQGSHRVSAWEEFYFLDNLLEINSHLTWLHLWLLQSVNISSITNGGLEFR